MGMLCIAKVGRKSGEGSAFSGRSASTELYGGPVIGRLAVETSSRLGRKGQGVGQFLQPYSSRQWAPGRRQFKSEEAIRYAREILEFVSAQMAEANAGS